MHVRCCCCCRRRSCLAAGRAVDVPGHGAGDAAPDGGAGALGQGEVQVPAVTLLQEAVALLRLVGRHALGRRFCRRRRCCRRCRCCRLGGDVVHGAGPLVPFRSAEGLGCGRSRITVTVGLGDEEPLGEEAVAELGAARGHAVAGVLPVLLGDGAGGVGVDDGGDGGGQLGEERRGRGPGRVEGEVEHRDPGGQLRVVAVAGEQQVPHEGEAAVADARGSEEHGVVARAGVLGDDVAGKGLDALVDEEAVFRRVTKSGRETSRSAHMPFYNDLFLG